MVTRLRPRLCCTETSWLQVGLWWHTSAKCFTSWIRFVLPLKFQAEHRHHIPKPRYRVTVHMRRQYRKGHADDKKSMVHISFLAWFKKCHLRVTPGIDTALMVKEFPVLGVTQF